MRMYSSLSFNIITALDRLPDRPNITELLLGHNTIATIAWNALAGLRFLQRLDISDNRLTYDSFLPAVVVDANQTATPTADGLPHLVHLDLSGNRLQSLSLVSFGRLPALRTLRLGRNDFVHLYGPTIETIIAMPALQALELSDNRLDTVPASLLEHLSELDELALDGNRLTKVPAALGLATNLRSLQLGNNPLGNLEGDK